MKLLNEAVCIRDILLSKLENNPALRGLNSTSAVDLTFPGA